MKEIKTERKVYDIHYEAIDGTEFRIKEECEKYEQTAHAVLKTKFNKLVLDTQTECGFFGVGGDDNPVYAIKVKSPEDVDTVFQLFCLDHPYALNDDDSAKAYKEKTYNLIKTAYMDKDILFVGESYDGDIYIINTRFNIIEDLKKIDDPKEEKK